MTKITKAIVALLGALATWGVTAAEDGVYTQVEIWGAVLALATAAAVWVAPNEDEPLGERGMTDIALVILTVVATLLVLFLFDLDVRQ